MAPDIAFAPAEPGSGRSYVRNRHPNLCQSWSAGGLPAGTGGVDTHCIAAEIEGGERGAAREQARDRLDALRPESVAADVEVLQPRTAGQNRAHVTWPWHDPKSVLDIAKCLRRTLGASDRRRRPLRRYPRDRDMLTWSWLVAPYGRSVADSA